MDTKQTLEKILKTIEELEKDPARCSAVLEHKGDETWEAGEIAAYVTSKSVVSEYLASGTGTTESILTSILKRLNELHDENEEDVEGRYEDAEKTNLEIDIDYESGKGNGYIDVIGLVQECLDSLKA